MSQWPDHLPVRSVRMARHTNQFDAIVRFYRDVIGLPEIGHFGGHGGYDGIMLGLPGQKTGKNGLTSITRPQSTLMLVP